MVTNMGKARASVFMPVLLLVTAVLLLLKVWHQSGKLSLNLLLQNWPIWFFWLAVVPVIWWLSGLLKVKGPLAAISFLAQVLVGFIIPMLFVALIVLLERSGHSISSGSFLRAYSTAFQNNIGFALFIHWSNTILAYVIRFIASGNKSKPVMGRYDNSILVKTSFGYVLVEITSFKYVKDGGRKILFETDRSTPLNRQRHQLKGTLVEENKYRNDRNIVIDLAKIRRAAKRGEDEYVFFVGFSHEIHLNKEMYLKLGGWLPRPVIEKKNM
jgi:hypothetical protein